MPAQHRYQPQKLALAIALTLGCVQLTQAQQPPDPVPPAEELIEILENFLNADTTFKHPPFKTKIPATNGVSQHFDDRDDLVILQARGSFAGLVDGGGGNNVLQLDAAKGGILGETRNFDGLEVKQGKWTSTGTEDFNMGALVRTKASLSNEGTITGQALTEGILINKGKINGNATVLAGGDLTNLGFIDGNVSVSETGHFAGSGAIGGLKVDGRFSVDQVYGAPVIERDLTLSRTAVLLYAVDASGASPTIDVKGTANLGDATLKLITAGDYPQSSQHTILTAATVVGEFGTVENNLAYMTPTLKYDKQFVGLTYTRNETPLDQLATTDSSQALAKSIEETPSQPLPPSQPQQPQQPESTDQPVKNISASPRANTAVAALLGTNKPTASLALEQLAAGSNANLANATLSSINPVSASMLSAMHQLDNRNGSSGSANAPSLAAGGEGSGRVWLQALGHGGKVDRDFDTLKHSSQGLVLGADWRLDEQWHVGLMGAKSQTRLDARQFDGDLDSWHLGAYAVRQDGPFALRLGASYAGHDGSGKRRVAFSGFSDRLKSNYDANTQQAFAEVGYNLGRGNVSIEPFASLGYQRYQRDDYTEKGGDAALKVHGQTQDNLSSTLGLRVAKINRLDNGMQLTPRLSASVKHTYGELSNETRQQLVSGGKSFEVAGAETDRNSLMLDAGLDLTLSARHTVGVGLTAEAGTDSRSHGVMGQWRMAF
ncbi:autotransporter domain-containing protein [Pseudomonas sp. NPDC087346]|uniref:autotransporter outer membrane beta-barrel domain-containing protein n=1 Tax=Pseudomonas sp. NPDC087346 TaxID=3364438 RepID=UPI0037FDFD02